MKKTIIALVAFVFIGGSVLAQDLNFKVSAGGGSYFSEEDTTFDTDALFGAVQLNALTLPIFDASSGVGAEVHFSSVDNRVNYTVWSLNRAEIVAGKVYGGTDMKFLESSSEEGVSGNFDLRIVTGAYLGSFSNGGTLKAEFYALEENRPISFAVMYQF